MQKALFATIAFLGLTGCNGLIYDDEGDCDPYFKVRFRYDYNMKFADAFSAEVEEVSLYVIDDNTGRVVWSQHESGEVLKQDGYLMDVDVAPGTYSLVAWCGKGHRSSFEVNKSDVAKELRCRLTDREIGVTPEDGDHARNYLENLYHGKLTAQVFPSSQGVHIYEVSLKKNTNNVHVVLQHLSGEPIKDGDFHFSVTDENGHMDWDNSLIADRPLTYHAWDVRTGTAGVFDPNQPDFAEPQSWANVLTPSRAAIVSVSCAMAEISMARLMEEHRESALLHIHDKEGNEVVRLPLIDYFLLVKGQYRKEMSNQEFLDRQDEYNMMLFLDEDNRWVEMRINIQSWKYVAYNENLD
ncbi:MAG: FimB/Mfa2 family fimbrial subunit [Duncaniella sp.]|nr:FimB/Mfa2 family fimbrial subunit [Duncaniella sp.]